jgi:hypothetical protein
VPWASNSSPASAERVVVCPRAGTLSNLCMSAIGGNFTGNLTVTVFVNGVSTALTVTVNSGSATGSDGTHTVAVNKFDQVSVSFTVTTGPGRAQWISVDFT